MLLDRFFQEARDVHMGVRETLSLTRAELVQIASEPALLSRFRTRLVAEVNDPDLRSLILAYLGTAAEDLDHSSRVSEMVVERIGWTVSAISVANVVVGAVITATGIFASASIIGGAAMIGAGLACVALVGVGTGYLKVRALKNKSGADRLRMLVTAVKDK